MKLDTVEDVANALQEINKLADTNYVESMNSNQLNDMVFKLTSIMASEKNLNQIDMTILMKT